MKTSRPDHRVPAACARLALPAALAMMSPVSALGADAAPNGFFTNAKPVAGLESGYFDLAPDISADHLTIYFDSPRPAGFRERPRDIFVATRPNPDAAFSAPVGIGSSVNSEYSESTPDIAPDGLTLYFASDRPGGSGGRDLYAARRSNVEEPFADVQNLGWGVNTSLSEWSPTVSADGLTLFFGSDRAGGAFVNADIYMATRSSTSELFGNVVKLDPAISTDMPQLHVSLSPDGLHLIYSQLDFPAAGSRGYSMHVASRVSQRDRFTQPINLNDFGAGSTINTASCSQQAGVLSADWPALGSKIYYTVDCSPDLLDNDIWEATWVPIPKLSITTDSDSLADFVVLSWPDLPEPAFALQETEDLTAGTWTDAPTGSTNPARIILIDDSKYFRLTKRP